MNDSNVIPIRTNHFMRNDHGGMTYATTKCAGEPDRRHDTLSEVRMVIDGLTELCTKVREYWPKRYPMPPELDLLMKFQDYALERVRSGELKRFAEVCES